MISDTYRALNAELHAARPDFGRGGHKFADIVRQLHARGLADSVVDYGCGKATLEAALDPAALGIRWRNYDPAIEAHAAPPEPADAVVCTDVLEHIEPDHLDAVLRDLARVGTRVAVLTISTVPAKKFLSDGRNAHLIVKPSAWWVERLQRYWFTLHSDIGPRGLFFVGMRHGATWPKDQAA